MNNIPRRSYVSKQKVVEMVIHNAINEVERLGCTESLTTAINHLQAALNIISDFIDERDYEIALKEIQ